MSFPPHARLGILLILVLPFPTTFADQPGDSATVDFGDAVRPILARHCLKCHGPDEDAREAGLRLDTQTGAHADLGGYQAVVPGKPEDSELIARVTSDDADLRMPPVDSNTQLTAAEIETLRRWVQQGGEYQLHWSFRPVHRPDVPRRQDDAWSRGPIDRFILNRMSQRGLAPSPEASKEALIRRLYMDLAGLVPSPEQVDAFLEDDHPLAYEKWVDRLLASPQYGERFARPWLDLARYSDTNGYEKDRERTIWPYRDWVIRAINRDMPFDQFSIEQLAGDMLRGATDDQRIATGFHRNTMLNEEGGIDPLEYRFYAMVDRVATTGTVWMGLTTGCAQCHTHKYDPITHTDYFSMMALMNNADEPEWNAESDAVARNRETIERRIAEMEIELADRLLLSGDSDPALRQQFITWLKSLRSDVVGWQPVAPTSLDSTLPLLSVLDDGSVLASGDATKRDIYTLQMPPIGPTPVTAIRIEALPHASLPATGPGLAFYEGRRGDFFLSELKIDRQNDPVALDVGTTTVAGAKPGNGKTFPGNVFDGDGSTGWSIPGDAGQTHRLVIPLREPTVLNQPWSLEMLFERHYVAALGHFRIDVTTAPDPKAIGIDREQQNAIFAQRDQEHLTPELHRRLATEFVRQSESLKSQRKPIDALVREIPAPVRTLVMQERPASNPRPTHRYHRGEYLKPKEVVAPNLPEVFASSEHQPKNRLEFARWLVSDANPLVGRVTVNRSWRELFGTGIVRTAGDFGTQSEAPSHPKLINWLDAEFRQTDDWSLKRLHRKIVLSATYRQSIRDTPAVDPDNRLLSVFPYRRFDAERIRDSFLAAAGLLHEEIGGKSVYPPQPLSVIQLAWGNTKWPTSEGESRYRRSLYTFSKRTAPFAAYTTFDAPSGEVCVARRDRSTTPLQALTLLNDEMYVEIADALAEAAIRDVRSNDRDATPEAIATRIFRRVLVRDPSETELDSILQFFKQQQNHPRPWMLVARVLMNTDEAITTP